ncbi:uncharacterized protein PV07_03948 [Cladophialophora immunda]|uniref:Uncharacterized protein n=1 Tax=Cladophialophora immunda TaxID=569365 RepID=A0A0D2D9L1_9EURO|nr:uncharacterized protein PV07_03948 [Cladophialophora immunda]KIW32399.1 hypothetical protein PV07_03948 [Cladophialophora immunda]
MTCSDTESDAASSSFDSPSHQDDVEAKDSVAVLQAVAEPARGRRKSRGSDKAAKCTRITTENERARTEAEAAGSHIKDYATGYGTEISGEKRLTE